ncbi:MAG: hypothetical protein ACE5D3_05815, partial [Candidatus Binatia bacterium]
MGLIGLLRRKKKIVEEPIEEPQAKASKGPELFVLVPEIAGAPTYHVNRFPNGDDGTQFIDESLSPVSRTGSHIFWALHEGPSSDIASNVDSGEALVLIRSARNVDTVHIVSFVDIESAQSFARFEVKRGLALDLLMIYWAAFAQVIETPFGLRLDPPEPPVYEAASPAVPAPPPAAANGHAPAGDSAATSDEASLSDEDLGPELRIMPEPDVKPSRDETRDAPPRLYLEDPPTLTEEEDEPEPVTGSLDTDEP